MVTYMDPQTVPSYISFTCAQRTLSMPNFMCAPHAQAFLSNIPKWDSKFGRAYPLTCDEPTRTKLSHFPPKFKIPNLHIVGYTCQFEQYDSHRPNECRAHPIWAPTKEPTVSCWRYTPTPKQDRFQDLLEAICPDF